MPRIFTLFALPSPSQPQPQPLSLPSAAALLGSHLPIALGLFVPCEVHPPPPPACSDIFCSASPRLPTKRGSLPVSAVPHPHPPLRSNDQTTDRPTDRPTRDTRRPREPYPTPRARSESDPKDASPSRPVSPQSSRPAVPRFPASWPWLPLVPLPPAHLTITHHPRPPPPRTRTRTRTRTAQLKKRKYKNALPPVFDSRSRLSKPSQVEANSNRVSLLPCLALPLPPSQPLQFFLCFAPGHSPLCPPRQQHSSPRLSATRTHTPPPSSPIPIPIRTRSHTAA